MNAFVMRAGAALIALATFVGAGAYVVAHPKNPDAPLQPPADKDVVLRVETPTPSTTPTPTPQTTPSGKATASARGTPPPRITLQPGVRTTALPGITFTHVS